MIDFKKNPLFISNTLDFSCEEIDNIVNNITKYTNIDFSMTAWPDADEFGEFYKNKKIIKHLANNIIDLDKKELSSYHYDPYTFLQKIYAQDYCKLTEYVINAGCNLTIQSHNYMKTINCNKARNLQKCLLKEYILDKSNCILKNTIKYYDTMQIMLLVMKVQKILPKMVIKYKIIPFIYN
jgi:hypothetical protein